MPKPRLLAFVIKELREVLPPTVFFAVSFNLLVLTTDLILADYRASFANFMVATMAALVVGKAVLLANVTPFLRRFDTAPMIQPVLFKTIVYWATVFLVRFLEKLVEYLFAGGTLSAIPEYVATHFTWHRFAAIQIWIFVLFLIYTSVEELNARLGDGELMKIFFTRRSREQGDSGTRKGHIRLSWHEADDAGSGFARSLGSAGEPRPNHHMKTKTNHLLVKQPLQVEALLAAVRRQTGLDDFGDESFREPLSRLLDSCENEAHLTLWADAF